MPHEAAGSRTTTPGSSHHVDGRGSPAGHRSAGGSDGRAGAVPLSRLLTVAVLTPAQACLVAAQVLQAAHRRVAAGDAQPDTGGLGAVLLTPAGQVEIGRPALDAAPVEEPLEQLAHNARRLPAHPRPEQVALLRRLEEAAGEPSLEPGVRAHVLLAALTDTLGAGAAERLTGQLAALVDAYAHLAGGPRRDDPDVPRQAGPADAPEAVEHRAAGPRTVRVPSRPAARRAMPAGQGPERAPRRGGPVRKHRSGARRVGIVVLVVLAVLVAGGYAVLRTTGTDVVDALGLGSGPAAPETTAPAGPTKQPAPHARGRDRSAVPTLAARRAGVITGVAVRKTGACTPGALCPIRVSVDFRPSSTGRTVTWKVGAARLCKRGITWSAPTSVTARPGWHTVYDNTTVRVPKGRSLALVALATAPDRAQSRPVPVTGSSLHC